MARILVVDDDRVYCDQLQRALAGQGHEVETADSARTALDVGRRFLPDVLLTDWLLRNHDHGIDVARKLSEQNADLKTIVMTGYSEEDLEKNVASGQVARVIGKPFSLAAIFDALAEVLRRESGDRSQESGD